MVPSNPHKSRKVTAHASHTKCKFHRDDHGLKKFCNAIRKNGSTCGTKLKRINYEKQVKRKYMPVCHQHLSQKIYMGHCEATAACGQRCNRPVSWKPSEYQLCSLHADIQLPSYLMRLPTELRMQIFEHVVPHTAGEDSMYDCRHKLRDTYNLFQLSRQINNEVSHMVFGTLSRTCEVDIDGDGFNMFGSTYSSYIPGASSIRRQHSIFEALQHRPERMRHLNLSIYASAMMTSNRDFIRGVVSAWSLARAIQPPSKRNQLVTLSIKFSFYDELDFAYRVTLAEEMFTVVKTFWQIFSLAGLLIKEPSMSIEVETTSTSSNNLTGLTSCQKRKLDILFSQSGVIYHDELRGRNKELQRDLEVEAVLFNEWRKEGFGLRTQAACMESWNMLQKLAVGCRAIYRLADEHAAPNFQHSFATQEDKRVYNNTRSTAYGRGILAHRAGTTLLNYAYAAFSHQDFAALQLLFERFQGMWEAFSARTAGGTEQSLTTLLSGPSTAAAERSDLDNISTSFRQRKLTWPKLTEPIKIPRPSHGKALDGVYKEFMIEGKLVRRLVTPLSIYGEYECPNEDEPGYSDYEDD